MIPLETNWLDCIKPFFLCREFFNNTLYFRNPALKAIKLNKTIYRIVELKEKDRYCCNSHALGLY